MISATPKPRTGEHTEGPWKAVTDTVHTIAGAQIADCSFAVKAEANARRIVACVNLLEGTPTDQIESDWKQGWEPYGAAKHFQAERDLLREREMQLAEALRAVLRSVPFHHSHLELKTRIETLLRSNGR